MDRGKMMNAMLFIAVIVGVVGSFALWQLRNKVPAIVCTDCNIVLIALDPLRADALSAYGNPRSTTPTLDALAQQGYMFTQAFAVAPWTLPSAMSLMTGTYPSFHHITNKELISKTENQTLTPARLSVAAPDLKTLASLMKELGYTTGGFAGGAALSASYGFDKGFDEYKSGDSFDGLPTVMPNALSFLRNHRNEKMFVFIHGFDVHGQYIPKDGYDRRYTDSAYAGNLTGSAEEQKALREDGVTGGNIFLYPGDVEFLRSLYDEKMARADLSIGEILTTLESLQLTKKTIVIFTSNHGEEFYEHGRIDHGMTLYDEVLHIPLIVVVPGFGGNKKIDTQVRNIDIIPTILALIGRDAPSGFSAQMKGTSLVPVMSGHNMHLDLYAETEYRYATFQKAIRTWDHWKLISDDESQVKHFYNLANDPKELNDVFITGEKKESELLDKLNRYSSEVLQAK